MKKIKPSRLVAIVVAAAVVVAGIWMFMAKRPAGEGAGSSAPAASSAASAANAPSVSVKTQALHTQTLLDTVSCSGDVASAQLVGLSFQRAGQVSRLYVLPGARVKKGAWLATLSPDPASLLAYRQAVNAAALARREWDRNAELFKLRLATQSQVESAQRVFEDAADAVKSLEAQGGGTADSRLVAPFDATVTSVLVAQGDRVAAAAPILQLGSTGAFRITLGIEPGDSARVRIGAPVQLMPVVPAGRKAVVISAAVSEVQASIDPRTQLVGAVVVLDAVGHPGLVSGMKVRAVLTLGSIDVPAVAVNAVLTDERGDYLFQVVDGKARRVAVRRLLEYDGRVGIAAATALPASGSASSPEPAQPAMSLNPAAPVVVVGNYQLQDGMGVRATAP